MKIVCVSDTHCQLKKIKLPDGDILVHSGDALSRGTLTEFNSFLHNLEKLKNKYKHIIYIPGNHDIITEQNETLIKEECSNIGVVYLNNSGTIVEGIKVWGSGITPRFHNWAWNKDSDKCGTSYPKDDPRYDPIEPYWDMIPPDTDILVTHGPPKGIMDISIYSGEECGCPYLWHKVMEIEPKYHIFGHIHHWHGKQKVGNTTFINASSCTEQYKPLNKPIVIEFKGDSDESKN